MNINCLILWVFVSDILIPNWPLSLYILKMGVCVRVCVCVCVFDKRPVFVWGDLLNWAKLIYGIIGMEIYQHVKKIYKK